jgi:hypothetical protein
VQAMVAPSTFSTWIPEARRDLEGNETPA